MDSSPHILVVDDDREIRDLVALDLMLPGEDGLSLCRRLRTESDLPVIMLTAMREDIDRIVGLEIGADDYLPKPFNPWELLARIRAVLRRAGAVASRGAPDGPGPTLRFAGWRLEPKRRRLVGPTGVRPS